MGFHPNDEQLQQMNASRESDAGSDEWGAMLFFVWMAACVGGIVYFWLGFDPSVDSPVGRIVNASRMHERQMAIIVCGIGAVVGVLFRIAQTKK
ncbi:MAG TPA: hypothetical protein VGP72_14660 [Planctomycetota bacterium]|jgi:hypothetical protein